MNSKIVIATLLIVGLLLTVIPPLYLYFNSYRIVKPIANTTFTFNNKGGLLFIFHGSKGDILKLIINNTSKDNKSVLIARLTTGKSGNLILQDKIEAGKPKQGSYTIVLPANGDYHLYIINPLNRTSTGFIVSTIERKAPLSESPKASTILLISVIGAVILGFAAAYKPSE